jgi:GMP synthase-like glutamine amidotransferase
VEPVAVSFRVIASHQDQVVDLPAGTRLFADAPTCPIAGFSAESIFTLQAHPEFTVGLATSLYRSRVEKLGRDTVDAALLSLEHPLDQPRVAGWIAAFVAGSRAWRAET